MTVRESCVQRKTNETDIAVNLVLDGEGRCKMETGIGFFDHMLNAFGRHGLFDLDVTAKGDLEVDGHHTVEDVGIVIGRAFREAIGDKRGINRFGTSFVPMDEALVLASLDISGRGQAHVVLDLPFGMVGGFDTQLAREFFIALATNAGITLHVRQIAGDNAHHIIEAAFTAVGRALCEACSYNPRLGGAVPSTKGSL